MDLTNAPLVSEPISITVDPTPVVIPPVPPLPSPETIQYASFWSRFCASLIDSFLIFLLMFILSLILRVLFGDQSNAESSAGITIVTSLIRLTFDLIIFSYYTYLLATKGQTPGKKFIKIKVININSELTPLGFGRSFLREFIYKLLSGFILFIGYFSMLWDSKKQTWHDKLAGTVVIKL